MTNRVSAGKNDKKTKNYYLESFISSFYGTRNFKALK